MGGNEGPVVPAVVVAETIEKAASVDSMEVVPEILVIFLFTPRSRACLCFSLLLLDELCQV